MPPLPSVPQVIKVQYQFTIGEDLGAICREFFRYTGAGASASDLDTLSSTIASSFNTNLASLMTPDRVLTSVTITDLTSPTSPEGSAGVTVVGTRSGGKLPASAALLESQIISRRYRGGHPRTYWPFGSDTDVQDAQTWTTAFHGAASDGLAAHFTDWSTDLVPGITSVENVNVSYYEGFTVHTGTTGRARNVSTPRSSPVVDVVVSEIIRFGIAQIRRRLLSLA
jgi:hypothetical protein